ncbi:MAG: hypothetical protein NZ934_04250 [Hadesarchaea archaeon]|nr:hypothetical protein [Hadesarchaea archaeon]
MNLTQVLKTLIVCILVIALVLVSASAYRQHRAFAELAALSDATSAIVVHLTADELAYVDSLGNRLNYVIDPTKFEDLDFTLEVGGQSLSFQVQVQDLRENGYSLGPLGPAPPNDRATCSLAVACSLRLSGRNLPAKLSVVAWYA